MTNTFLLNDFYTVKSTQKPGEHKLLVNVRLNAAHAIFKGHFEQMPVVPGVCQTQMIKELLQAELAQDLVLTKGDNIKFTGMIIPNNHPEFFVELSYVKEGNNYKVEASLFFENSIFTKFKGTFAQS